MIEVANFRLSIVIPTLNEAKKIDAHLLALQPFRAAGQEVIVADGGSCDDTALLAAPLVDYIIVSKRGRGFQMNAGAKQASGDILLFLHSDTKLPATTIYLVREGLSRSGKSWGRFNVRLSGSHPMLRVIEYMMNLRSRLTGIATGDQAIFVRREAFQTIGGFESIPLMEDIALSYGLKRAFGRPLCITVPVITSSRLWEHEGILRTMLLMWRLRLAYFFGVSPHQLVKDYYPRKSER